MVEHGARRTATATVPTIPDSIESGARIGKYTLIAKVGHGGMAEVFLAAIRGPAAFTKLCVLKRLHPHLESDPSLVGMFLDEARLAARLSHPNVVQTYEVADSGGSRFLTMEFLEGQPLSRVLNRLREIEQKLPLSVGVRIFIDALDGLHYAHTLRDFDGSPLNVVHRDVSPSNIFLTYDGQSKVLDFGIAKAGTHLNETQAGQVKGKFAYIAPEQAQPGRHDHRVDLWALGVVMWEAFSGKRLFKGESEVSTLHNALTSEIPLLDQVCNVPMPLARIVERALQRDPALRYQTARQMREDLEDLMLEQGLRASRGDVGALVTDLFERERDEQRLVLSAYMKGEASAAFDMEDIDTGEFSGSRPRAPTEPSHRSSAEEPSSRRGAWVAAVFVLASLIGAVAALALRPIATPVREAHSTLEDPGSRTHSGMAEPIVERSLAAPEAAPLREEIDAPATDTSPAETRATPEGRAEAAPARERGASPIRISVPRAPRASPRRPAPRRPSAMEELAMEAHPTTTEPSPPAIGTGFLTFDTIPWSQVTLDGRVVGTTPLIREALPVGSHILTLVNPEQNIRTTYRITIRAGENTTRRVGLQ